jgi:sugar fermentation stimulation protein A
MVTPKASATASAVMSSWVGPMPPEVKTWSKAPLRCHSASTIRACSSATTRASSQADAVVGQRAGQVVHVGIARAAGQDLVSDHQHGGGWGLHRVGSLLWRIACLRYRPGPMRFQTPLVPGTLIRRYKRFLADVLLENGREVTAHCPNPGAMMGLSEPGMRIWLEPNDDPKKKLKFGWRLVELGLGHMAGIDTSVPNRIVFEALTEGRIAALTGYSDIRPEQRYGENSRIDFLLREPGRPDAYVEVKNVHLRREGDWAEFPDCVTARGAKHLNELARIAEAGGRAVMLYIVQRTDCAQFRLAPDLDPAYAAAFDTARERGVEMLCHATAIDRHGITLTRSLPVDPRSQAAREDFAGMHAAGRLAADILDRVAPMVVPGTTTGAIDVAIEAMVEEAGATSATIGYRGYQHASCISVNHVVCHGIPGPRC